MGGGIESTDEREVIYPNLGGKYFRERDVNHNACRGT